MDRRGNVRVGDFGLAEDIYTRGYFRQDKGDAIKLPFKWMAPESLRDGLFSEKSDVVSTPDCRFIYFINACLKLMGNYTSWIASRCGGGGGGGGGGVGVLGLFTHASVIISIPMEAHMMSLFNLKLSFLEMM